MDTFTSPLSADAKATLMEGIPEEGTLTRQQVTTLLERAEAERHPQGRAMIQVRLGKLLDNEQAQNQFDNDYVDGLRAGTLASQASELCDSLGCK